MRRLVLLLVSLLAASASAQQGHDLRIETYFLSNASTNQSLIAVRFTNISSHLLYLPTDNVFLADHPVPESNFKGLYYPDSIFSCLPMPGLISASFQFKAQNPQEVTQCGEQAAVRLTSSTPLVLARAKSWTVLQPGESTTRQAPIAWVLPIQAGSFSSVRAVYRSPYFSPAEQRQLREAGITVPAGDYVSGNSFRFWTDGIRVTLVNSDRVPARVLLPITNR